MESTWSIDERSKRPAACGRLLVSAPKLRTSLLPRSIRPQGSVARENSFSSIRCLPTRYDFPV